MMDSEEGLLAVALTVKPVSVAVDAGAGEDSSAVFLDVNLRESSAMESKTRRTRAG